MCAKLHSVRNLSNVIACDTEWEKPKGFRSGFPFGLKRARQEAGLKQDEFGNKFHVSLATVRGWEQGRHVPEIETIEQLCDFFHCSIDYLLGRTNYRDTDDQLIFEATGLGEDAIASLHSFTGDAKAMEVINCFLTNRILLRAIIRLFESEFWDENCIDELAEGRAISGVLRPEEKKLRIINVVDSLMLEIKRFYKDHEDNQTFSKQMVFRLLQDIQGSAENVYRRLCTQRFSDEQTRVAVEFLLYCGYKERMEQDGFDFRQYIDQGENTNG